MRPFASVKFYPGIWSYLCSILIMICFEFAFFFFLSWYVRRISCLLVFTLCNILPRRYMYVCLFFLHGKKWRRKKTRVIKHPAVFLLNIYTWCCAASTTGTWYVILFITLVLFYLPSDNNVYEALVLITSTKYKRESRTRWLQAYTSRCCQSDLNTWRNY